MIEIDHVTKTFGDERRTGRWRSTTSRSSSTTGEVVALVGSSGSGKTTTLRMINRLIEPSSGHDHGRRPGRRRRCRPTSCGAASATSSSRAACSRTAPCSPTWRPCPACSAGTRREANARARELLDLVGLDPSVRRPLPGPAVGRPAAARRRRPGPGRRPAGAADGRAVRRRRPDRAGPAAARVRPAAARARQDRRVRDPRRRRGDRPRRPHRRARDRAGGWPSCATPAELLGQPGLATFVADFLGGRDRRVRGRQVAVGYRIESPLRSRRAGARRGAPRGRRRRAA